jgi:hypothetical protein
MRNFPVRSRCTRHKNWRQYVLSPSRQWNERLSLHRTAHQVKISEGLPDHCWPPNWNFWWAAVCRSPRFYMLIRKFLPAVTRSSNACLCTECVKWRSDEEVMSFLSAQVSHFPYLPLLRSKFPLTHYAECYLQFCSCFSIVSPVLFIHSSMALQPFEPWPLFHFLNPIHSQ